MEWKFDSINQNELERKRAEYIREALAMAKRSPTHGEIPKPSSPSSDVLGEIAEIIAEKPLEETEIRENLVEAAENIIGGAAEEIVESSLEEAAEEITNNHIDEAAEEIAESVAENNYGEAPENTVETVGENVSDNDEINPDDYLRKKAEIKDNPSQDCPNSQPFHTERSRTFGEYIEKHNNEYGDGGGICPKCGRKK